MELIWSMQFCKNGIIASKLTEIQPSEQSPLKDAILLLTQNFLNDTLSKL